MSYYICCPVCGHTFLSDQSTRANPPMCTPTWATGNEEKIREYFKDFKAPLTTPPTEDEAKEWARGRKKEEKSPQEKTL